MSLKDFFDLIYDYNIIKKLIKWIIIRCIKNQQKYKFQRIDMNLILTEFLLTRELLCEKNIK